MARASAPNRKLQEIDIEQAAAACVISISINNIEASMLLNNSILFLNWHLLSRQYT